MEMWHASRSCYTRQCPGRGERYAPVSGTLSATRQGVQDTSPCPRVDHTFMQATYETQPIRARTAVSR
eukprot:2003326-Prymnesium_polylepis.1